jgi:hypothetical protein
LVLRENLSIEIVEDERARYTEHKAEVRSTCRILPQNLKGSGSFAAPYVDGEIPLKVILM